MLITSGIICRVYLGFSKVAFYSVVICVYRADFKTSQTFKGLYQGMVTFLPFPLSLERPVILIDLCHYLQAMLNQIIAAKGLQKLDNISSEACPVSGSGSPVVVQLPSTLIRPVNGAMIRISKLLFKWLNRRGGRGRMSWEKYMLFLSKFPLPKPRIMVNLFASPRSVLMRSRVRK